MNGLVDGWMDGSVNGLRNKWMVLVRHGAKWIDGMIDEVICMDDRWMYCGCMAKTRRIAAFIASDVAKLNAIPLLYSWK